MSLRVAIAGLKGHQGAIISGIPKVEGARLTAVADTDPAALEGVRNWACADEETETYTDWREMMEAEEIDILGEAGVDSDRHAIIIAAAEKGAHCICEKPLANTLPNLADVRKAVEDSGIHLSMLLTMRFEPAYEAIRKIILNGDIGDVCLATFQKSYRLGNRPEWQRSSETFSGIIPFIGIHALDCIRWCTGREYTQVFGYCDNVAHPDVRDMEDQGQVLCKLDNGGTASARLDYCRPAAAPSHGDDRIRVAGTKGVIESLYSTEQVTLIDAEEGVKEVDVPAEKVDQFVDFVASTRGERQCRVPAADCFRMTEVVLKARASARHGRPYEL